MSTDGVAVWTEDGWDELFYPGYHTTFHTNDYIRAHWSQWFDVLSIHEEPPRLVTTVDLRARDGGAESAID